MICMMYGVYLFNILFIKFLLNPDIGGKQVAVNKVLFDHKTFLEG